MAEIRVREGQCPIADTAGACRGNACTAVALAPLPRRRACAQADCATVDRYGRRVAAHSRYAPEAGTTAARTHRHAARLQTRLVTDPTRRDPWDRDGRTL